MKRETLLFAPHDRCEVHAWPDDGLAARIILAIRSRGRGGISICLDCGVRAKASLRRRLETMTSALAAAERGDVGAVARLEGLVSECDADGKKESA
jgi:hypothetical protein